MLKLSYLFQVQEELVQAIKDAEDGLLHLKRARLLREVDSALHDSKHNTGYVKVEPLDPNDVEPEQLEEQSYSVGSKCRFRYNDGRWYNGKVIELEGSNTVKISFLTPISENMMVRYSYDLMFICSKKVAPLFLSGNGVQNSPLLN